MVQDSACGGWAVFLFFLTVALFFVGWASAVPDYARQGRPDHSFTIAMSSLASAVLGVIAGVMGCARHERRPGLAVAGLVLNLCWLLTCGVIVGVVGSAFSGSPH